MNLQGLHSGGFADGNTQIYKQTAKTVPRIKSSEGSAVIVIISKWSGTWEDILSGWISAGWREPLSPFVKMF